jgi:hypothetical protein
MSWLIDVITNEWIIGGLIVVFFGSFGRRIDRWLFAHHYRLWELEGRPLPDMRTVSKEKL